jgi:hypothetical protein
MRRLLSGVVGTLALLVTAQANAQAGGAPAAAQQPRAGFFITSVGVGNGGNLGGLAGADRHCQTLAQAAGFGDRVWRAYLSAAAAAAQPAVNARDRIGAGPWYNSKGALIASNVADLHGDMQRDRNSINKEFALDEKGNAVKGRGDTPNTHDMLTGSDSEGRLPLGSATTTTCDNWTNGASGAFTMLGHHDRSGGGNSSWNAAHLSRGCSQADLVATGGAGLFYCFAAS